MKYSIENVKQIIGAKIDIHSVEFLGAGNHSEAFCINKNLVIKLPKHKKASACLEREIKVLEQIQGKFLLAMQNGRYTAGETGGEETHTLTVDELPSHYHNAPLPNNNNQNEKTTGYGAYLTNVEWFDGGSDLSVAGDFSIRFENMPQDVYTGGNQPHNNMPPYLVVYMWQRTE